MNTKTRILKYLDNKGLTKTIFFTQTGIKRGFLDADKLSGAVNDEHFAKILVTYPDLNLEWLITGEGEMLKSQTASPGLQTHTIYIDNPDKDEIISLQRDKIKLLDRQLTMTEDKLKQFELLNLEDARFGAAHGVVEPTSATSERAIDDFMLRKNQS